MIKLLLGMLVTALVMIAVWFLAWWIAITF
jgi:hypothetical protein